MHAYPRGTDVDAPMCRTKSVVAGHPGAPDGSPSNRAITRAAARSLVHGTSVKLVVPNELHSSTARNSAPYPDGPGDVDPPPGRSRAVPEEVWHPHSPVTASAAVSSAPSHVRVPRIAHPPVHPRPA
ncbi:hypothetical protein GCM10010448_59650 [Streptomyces glomeratus]|uniref:Uncharacterized protein n=1 Tax=Streptomyces glomeratus TaxID=284452 RepID=A0ABP6M1E0_9ACTN